MIDDELIALAREKGWGSISYASGPSTHPMCLGQRSVETGPRQGDELLQGSPPGHFHFDKDGTGYACMLDIAEWINASKDEIDAYLG